MTEPDDRLHLMLGGRVQGVGFREHVRRAALRCDVGGWVRNRIDGRVEAVLVGTSTAVDAAASEVARGPRPARVDTLARRVATDPEAALATRPLTVRDTA